MRIPIILALLSFAGCADKPATNIKPAAEIDVVVAFLQTNYDESLRKGAVLIIEDTLSMDILGAPGPEFTRSLVSQASAEIPADLIKDFCRKNTKPQPAWPELASRLHAKLLSRTESKSLFDPIKPDPKKDGWRQFYERYPGSPGIITVSRVGFNKNGDLALFYMGSQSHWLAGSGQLHVMKSRMENGSRCPL